MKKRGVSPIGIAALAGASALYSISAAATGGVITFVGAITAQGFSISAGPGSAGSRTSTAEQTQVADSTGRTVYVTYFADPTNPPNAELSVAIAGRAPNSAALNAAFHDGKGRKVKPDSGGTYRVGALGGTLSLQAKDGAAPPLRQVTVVTSYR